MSKKQITLAVSAIAVILIIATCLTLAVGRRGVPSDSGKVQGSKGAEDPFCLLVLGKDRVSGLTDVMMLVSFDIKDGRICVMQIPRDTYAEYGELKHSKLNSAMAVLGGERALCDYLSSALGVPVDGYLSMELEGFRNVVDAVGGVEIELDSTLYYNDPEQDLQIYLKKGRQLLDGEKAEMLVRYRSGYLRGDLDRLDMQKKFLAALFARLKDTVNSSNAYALAEAVLPHVTTDVSLPLAVALGLEALRVDSSSLVMLTLPGEDIVSPKTGASYYVMSREPAKRIIENFFAKEETNIDPQRLFEHPEYDGFRAIYARDDEPEVTYADGLK